MKIDNDTLLHPAFLRAQKCALTLWGNGADALIDSYAGRDVPIPGVLLTTSDAIVNFMVDYTEAHHPDIAALQERLYATLEAAEEKGLLTEELEGAIFDAVNALEEQVTVDPLKDWKSIIPVHGCHTGSIMTVVLARLNYPEDALTLKTNHLHTTVQLDDGSHFDLLVGERDIARFEEQGSGYSELSLEGLTLDELAEETMRFVLDIDLPHREAA